MKKTKSNFTGDIQSENYKNNSFKLFLKLVPKPLLYIVPIVFVGLIAGIAILVTLYL